MDEDSLAFLEERVAKQVKESLKPDFEDLHKRIDELSENQKTGQKELEEQIAGARVSLTIFGVVGYTAPENGFIHRVGNYRLERMGSDVANLFERLFVSKKRRARRHKEQGSLLFKLERYAEATEHFDRGINLDPNFALAYVHRSLARCLLDDYEGALEDLNQAIRIDSDGWLPFLVRSTVKRGLNDFSGSLEDSDTYLTLKEKADRQEGISNPPVDADHYLSRALSRFELEDLKGTIIDCNQAIQINPALASAYNVRGAVRCQLGDLQGAKVDLDIAIKLAPDDSAAYSNRGIVLERQGDQRKAITDYNVAISLNPTSIPAYENRARLLEEIGDLTAARSDYNKLLELDYTNEVALDSMDSF